MDKELNLGTVTDKDGSIVTKNNKNLYTNNIMNSSYTIMKNGKDISDKFSKRINKIIKQSDRNQHALMNKNDELALYKDKLEKLIEKERQSAKIKEDMLITKSKMATMGEMFENIVHQWKQPLSSISILSSGLQLSSELNSLNDQKLDETCEKINSSVNYLSTTIDTFKNFLKTDKVTISTKVHNEIKTALDIVSIVLKDNGIMIQDSIDYTEEIYLEMTIGELPQVIINIINNAKDILVEKNISNPWIKLDFIKNESSFTLSIEDNAGGIPMEFIDKVFDPYFTTKPEDKGTGIGLNISKDIIQSSFNGKLYVNNTQNGAKFYIEIPL